MGVADSDGELEGGNLWGCWEVELDVEVVGRGVDVLLSGSDAREITDNIDSKQVVADVAVVDQDVGRHSRQ